MKFEFMNIYIRCTETSAVVLVISIIVLFIPRKREKCVRPLGPYYKINYYRANHLLMLLIIIE